MGDYPAVTEELLECLLESRLYDRSRSLEMAVLGDPAGQKVVDDLIRPFEKIHVGFRSDDLHEYEFPALGLLQDACRDSAGYVYYIHTKGVSRGPNQYARYWRQLMLDHVVMDHRSCVDALADHDAVGTNWRGNHFSGNFWWARAEYVRRLPDIRTLRRRPWRLTRDPTWNTRLQCEFWLAMGRGRFKNLGVRDLDLYQTVRWSVNAADIINMLLDAVAGERYLEIVTGGPSPYHDAVRAAQKDLVEVAPTSSPEHAGSALSALSDDAAGPYDVIFVDNWHDEDHSRGVLEGCLPLLAPHGAIVIHDSNPPTSWHQRPADEFVPGSEWNGEVWKAVVRFRSAHPEVDVRTVDTDWGCTVIRPGIRARGSHPVPADDLTWERFDVERRDFLNVISVRRFRRDLYAVPHMLGRASIESRTDVINCLVSVFGFERYLEIGVGDGANLERIIAPIRQSVDVEGSPTFRMSSDDFFAQRLGCDRYDLVFVDALHEESQCLRDIEHALVRLTDDGCIVVHDTNPPTEWHQRDASEYEPGTDWNGTVWKAIVRFRERHPDVGVTTLDVDWGCTIIRPRATARALGSVPTDLTWTLLAERRRELLDLQEPTWEALIRATE